MKEENVYMEKEYKTEGEKTMESGAEEKSGPENASAVLGKFKDVNALARAYESLQAEFTRRSQRLKELEKIAKNQALEGNVDLGVEKLRKNLEKQWINL